MEQDSKKIETSTNHASGGNEISCEKNEPITSNEGCLTHEIPEVSCQEPVDEEEVVRIDSLVDGDLNQSNSQDTTFISGGHGDGNFCSKSVSNQSHDIAADDDDQLTDNIPLNETTVLAPDDLEDNRNDTSVKAPLNLGTESVFELEDHHLHHQNSSEVCADEIPSCTKPCNYSNGCCTLENGCKCDGCKPDTDTNDREVNVHSSPSRSDLSTSSAQVCSIRCCTGCLNILYGATRTILQNELGSNWNNWTAEDVHDIVAALSVDLLAAVRRAFLDGNDTRVFNDRRKASDSRTCDCKSWKDMVFTAVECICHCEKESWSEKVSPSPCSDMGLETNFIFRDGVLVSQDPNRNVPFHCKLETLCLCSLTELIVMANEPFNG